MWKTLETIARAAEEIEERVEAVKDVRDRAEATMGRAVLTGRFVKRGRDMSAHLRNDAEQGKPPGILKTGEEILNFLAGNGDDDGVERS